MIDEKQLEKYVGQQVYFVTMTWKYKRKVPDIELVTIKSLEEVNDEKFGRYIKVYIDDSKTWVGCDQLFLSLDEAHVYCLEWFDDLIKEVKSDLKFLKLAKARWEKEYNEEKKGGNEE